MGSLVVSKNYQHFKVTLICLSSGSSSERPWPIPCMILGASSFYWHFFFYEIGSLKLLPLPHTAYPLFPIPKQNNRVIASTILSVHHFCYCPRDSLSHISAKGNFTPFVVFMSEDKYGQHKIIAGKKMGHYLR